MACSRNCCAVADCLAGGLLMVSKRALQVNQGRKQARVQPLGGLTHWEICISYSGLKVIRRPAVAAISCLRGQFLHHGLPGKFPTIFGTCKSLSCGRKPRARAVIAADARRYIPFTSRPCGTRLPVHSNMPKPLSTFGPARWVTSFEGMVAVSSRELRVNSNYTVTSCKDDSQAACFWPPTSLVQKQGCPSNKLSRSIFYGGVQVMPTCEDLTSNLPGCDNTVEQQGFTVMFVLLINAKFGELHASFAAQVIRSK